MKQRVKQIVKQLVERIVSLSLSLFLPELSRTHFQDICWILSHCFLECRFARASTHETVSLRPWLVWPKNSLAAVLFFGMNSILHALLLFGCTARFDMRPKRFRYATDMVPILSQSVLELRFRVWKLLEIYWKFVVLTNKVLGTFKKQTLGTS